MADQQLKEHLQQGKFAYEDDMKKLRKLVEDEIIKRRRQQVSLEEVKEFTTAKYINSVLAAFRKINPSKWPNKIQNIDFIKVLYDLQEKVEKLMTYKDQTPYSDHAGCDAACTGLCASCTGNCTGGNSGQCSGGSGYSGGIDYSGGRLYLTMTVTYNNDSGTFNYPVYYEGGKLYYGGGQATVTRGDSTEKWNAPTGMAVGSTRQNAAEGHGSGQTGNNETSNAQVHLKF